MSRPHRSAIDQIELVRNSLAFLLVAAFVMGGGALFYFVIPEPNKEIVTYMVGQLSGMATTALGFYFVNKVGQDALDAKRAENTGKLADVAKTALTTADGGQVAAAAEHVVEGAEQAAAEVKGG